MLHVGYNCIVLYGLDLRSDFDERVDAYIVANLEADECDK